tara:strand:+ start:316 stop:600 length:285 start_codon:yes stop_codon:yes gene_type:complete
MEFDTVYPEQLHKRMLKKEFSIDSEIDLLHRKYKNQKKILDKLLCLDAQLYMNLGLNSTKADKAETKKESRKIYRAIKKIDPKLGDLFLVHQDK